MSNEENQLNFLKPEYKSVGVYEISFNEKNVRKINRRGFEKLKRKILENVYEPIKVWKRGNIVLSGNQRLAVIRDLIENEGYDIPSVDVAIYDVDERTAKFIELSSNEHEGDYDFDKLLENWDDITSLDLGSVLDDKMTKKLEEKLSSLDVPPPEDEDLSNLDRTMDDTVEVESTKITIANVPKTESYMFYDCVDRVSKITGLKREWDCIKIILDIVDNMDANDIHVENAEEV